MNQPLVVGLIAGGSGVSRTVVVNEIIQRMSSVIRLSLSSRYAADPSALDTLLHLTPAPALESLHLSKVPLSRVGFSGHHPRLSDLSLSACNVNWPADCLSGRFTNLRSLELYGGGSYRRPESYELIQTLSSLKTLQRLHMVDAGPLRFVRVSPVTGMQKEPSSPPALETLVIRDTADALTATLMSLSIPPQARPLLSIEKWQANRLSPEHRSALDTLGRQRANGDRSFYKVHIVSCLNTNACPWEIRVFEDTADRRADDSEPWLRIRIAPRDGSASGALHHFFETFRFGRTITLVIDFEGAVPAVPPETWSEVLQAFDLVKEIRVIGLVPELCAALFFPIQLGGPYTYMFRNMALPPHRSPLLRTATLVRNSMQLISTDLIGWLKQRFELHNGIECLAFIECAFDFTLGDMTEEEFTTSLHQYVVDIRWS